MTSGSCLCGSLKFEVSDYCSSVFKCHCSKCRKAFGGASSAAVLAREDDFRWTNRGEDIRQYTTDSGFTRFFCAGCGGILPQHLPNYRCYWIPAGLLEPDPRLKLGQHIHVNSMAHWEVLDEHSKRLPEGFDA